VSPADRPSAWWRFRQFVRRVLGRTRFDDLERQLLDLRERAGRSEALFRTELQRFQQEQGSAVEVTQDAVQGLADLVRAQDDRLVESFTEQFESQWRIFEDRRAPLIALIDQLRSAVEEGVNATARMDSMIVRSIEKGQEIESEVQRRGSRLGEALETLRSTVADAVQRLEERHQEWLSAQRTTQRALADQHEAIEGRWAAGLAELQRSFAAGAERGAHLQQVLDGARERERALADQAAHLIEVLGQTRRELAVASERAAEADEARAARSDLQRELDRVSEDLAAASAEIEEVREAHQAFHRWKESSDAEIARLGGDRDRLLLESMRAEEARRGAHDPSFGSRET
jgi:hypothetical protein